MLLGTLEDGGSGQTSLSVLQTGMGSRTEQWARNGGATGQAALAASYTSSRRNTCQLRPGCGVVPQEILPASQWSLALSPGDSSYFPRSKVPDPQPSLNKFQADMEIQGPVMPGRWG